MVGNIEVCVCLVEGMVDLVCQGGPVLFQVPVLEGNVHVYVIPQDDQVLVN